MERLTLDERTCVVEALTPDHLLALRLVDRAWREAVDVHVKQTYEGALEDFLSHLRIRGRRPSWLLRYAVADGREDKDYGYVCAKCGAEVHELATCQACRPRRHDFAPLARHVLAAACLCMCFVTFFLLVVGLYLWWWWRARRVKL